MLMALDVAIGLVLTFSLVSLLASQLNEWVSALLKMRGQMLWKAVDDLLGEDLSRQLGQSEQLKSLRQKSWVDVLTFWHKDLNREKVSYLPTDTFVRTTLAALAAAPLAVAAAESTGGEGSPTSRLPKVLAGSSKLLESLVQEAQGDVAKLKQDLAAAFEATMNEVSGWYKRWSQVTLFVIGLGIAVLLGVDAVAVTQRLATDPELRKAVGQQAESILETRSADPAAASEAADPEAAEKAKEEIRELLSTIEGSGLPLIQPPPCRDGAKQCASWERQWGRHWTVHWPGFLLTALATCLGAPFWFDLLKRLINLRTSFKPAGATGEPASGRAA